MILKQLLE